MIPEPFPTVRSLPEEGESWLFISYSRTTSELAQGLTDALEARGYLVWIDQESITPASDWRARISVGIEGARAVVLIISERFIASPNCDRELVEAQGLGKRLIPILAEDLPIDRLPAPVPDLDLIVAIDGDLGRVVDEVVEAVETDIEWLDEHTRLLQSSLRWAETPDDRSLLLRGRDLRTMLLRVAAAANRSPNLTQGQRSFLAACEDNRRRLRNLSWAAGLAAIVIMGLAVVASVQRAAAVDARTGAEAQRIAVDAQALYNTQLDLGLRLALAAWSYRPNLATESALLRGLTFGPGLRATTVVAPAGLDDAIFTDTGRSIVLLDDNGATHTWDESGAVEPGPSGVVAMTTGGATTVFVTADAIELPGGASCASPGRVLAVGAASWGAVVAVAEGDGSRVIAVDSNCASRPLATTSARVSTFGSSPSGSVAWGTRRGVVTVIDSAGTEIGTAAYDGAGVTSLAFGPGHEVAVGLDNGTVAVLGGVEIDRAHRGAVTAIVFAREGVVSAGADGWIRLWEAGRLALELTDVGPNGQAASILDITQWAPGGLVSIDSAGRAQGWDLTSRSPLVTLADQTPGVDQLIAVDGGWVAVGVGLVSAQLVDVPDAEVTAVARANDAFVFGDSTGGVWRLVEGRWVRTQGRADLPVRFVAGAGPVWADAMAVYSGDLRWEVTTRALLAVENVAFAATADGEVLRLSAGGVEVAFDEHRGTVDALALSPDSTLVASGGDDRLVYVWDRQTGEVTHTFVGHTDRVVGVAFSRDGLRLASVGEDDRMIIWDLESNSMVGSPITHPGSVRIEAVAWAGDSALLTGGPGVFRWTLGFDDLVAAACRLVGPRQPTEAEVAQYLDGVEARDPC